MKTKREKFIPENFSAHHVVGKREIYEYEKTVNGATKHFAIYYCGKSTKPFHHYEFGSREHRIRKISEDLKYFDQIEQWDLEREVNAEKEGKAFLESLEKGTILSYSWGYDQTNIQYYQVVNKKKATVVLQEIEKSTGPEDGFMTAKVVPKKDCFKGTEFCKRVNVKKGGYIRMDFGIAKIWCGEPERVSWYA